MPEIDDHLDRESVYREFRQITDSTLTQSSVLGVLNETLPAEAVIVAAAGSLPGDLQRVWRNRAENTYHVEYGYSCMGYEVNAALGVKLAQPQSEVYSTVGDGSFMMLHSELVTSLQERAKINVVLFDNMANGCINNLQMEHGMDSFGTESSATVSRKPASCRAARCRWTSPPSPPATAAKPGASLPRTNCATRWTPPVAKRSAL